MGRGRSMQVPDCAERHPWIDELYSELENLVGKVSRARAYCETFDSTPATA